LTSSELRADITERFAIGQTVGLWLKSEEKAKEAVEVKVKIVWFYPAFVLTEKNGIKESYSYFDFRNRLNKPEKVEKKETPVTAKSKKKKKNKKK
jgi:hypothetical protein